MEYQPIKDLLDRYFEGETTLEEEKQLRAYFTDGPVDKRLQPYAPLFQWAAREQEQQLELAKASQMIDRIERKESRIVRLGTGPRLWILRVAAVLALLVGMWWAYEFRQTTDQTAEVDWSKYEITDEREALNITRGAFLRASKTLNEGANAAAEQMDRMQEIGKFFK
ncbi:hypothetical protein [Flavilitoribacter nigricans]|uniref:Zinc-finger domain-containing protein n=1 Tax=Flavilitoribacter nigricans (strain ATCC 23147 / DSM 23189 / NBRC 102662 / NCIMB 1420 / SS-2) TaxID=1122177 RepID=A0A2D0N7H1_FLAN2|nr:hypothetical protein [Flavilitoribacter nigricans]PHN04461.1 hypothetical protein CRP01_20855 [Flavilitoribacter nigricans DSM 23189 = NBRC 102662]